MILIIKNFINDNLRFFKYCLGGGVAFILDLSLLYILTEFLGLWYLWSATLSFVVVAMVNYTIQKYWTFKNDDRNLAKQFFLFLVVQTFGLLINNLTLFILVEYIGFWYLSAKVLAAGLVLIWNYRVGKALIFDIQHSDYVLAGEIFPPEIGGPATYTYRLARYFLVHRSSFSALCYSRFPLPDSEQDLRPFVTLVNSRWPLPIRYFLYFLKLFLRSIHAKIIYAQGPVASGWPALLVAGLLRKKLAVKIVGDYAWEQAQLERATLLGIDDWQNNPEPESKNIFLNFKLRLLNKIERLVVRRADCIIVPSHYLKKIVLGWGANQDKVKVVYNSISLKSKTELTPAAAQERIGIVGDLIITVARLLPWKGIVMLIEIMPEILALNPAFKLLIAGNGPEENSLRLLVAEKKLTPSVFFLGRLSQDELAVCYRASCLFVLNSGYEGLSHSIIDAMNYRLPVIASAIGGNPELIQDDYNGLLVEYNNRSEWVAAIERLWSNGKLRARLVSSPLTKLDVFSFDNMIKETIHLLDSFSTKA